ncbi:PaaI family thioesterase [Flavobacterium sp. XS2P39]|uniref:PaaI family thioesterase n=1 Tax=Flavobacterium sp. XS2P39 TaxID=3401725 RepID=UPI003AAEF577
MNQEPLNFLIQHKDKVVTNSPSPFMDWLMPTVVFAEKGKLIFQYKIRKEMTNPFGTLHGGVTAAIMDDAIGASLITYGEPSFYITVNLAIDYFGTAKEGDLIISETFIIKKGKQITNASCEIWNNDKTKLLARGYTNLLKQDL